MFHIPTRYGYWFCFYEKYARIEYRPAGGSKEPSEVSEEVPISSQLREKLPESGSLSVSGFNGYIDPWLHTELGDELFEVTQTLYDLKDRLMHC